MAQLASPLAIILGFLQIASVGAAWGLITHAVSGSLLPTSRLPPHLLCHPFPFTVTHLDGPRALCTSSAFHDTL